MDTPSNLNQITTRTAQNLKNIAQSQPIRNLSRLSLPEIEAVADLTAQIVPAGNVPGMILSGLARLPEQRLPPKTVQQHVDTLFKGVEQVMDTLAFGALFAGPAAVIWGYQNLLKLAGKDPEAAFPEGTWQFYVNYALREDTARHVNETHGFDTLLEQHGIRLGAVDRLAAWVMAAISVLHQYDSLLEIEWRERVSTALLADLARGLPEAARCSRLYREWESQRPYRRDDEAARFDYPTYRRHKFDQFMRSAMQGLPQSVCAEWAARMQAAEVRDLRAYQRQMSILAYLHPGPYAETRVPFALQQASIGIIFNGNYVLLPVCQPGTDTPLDALTVRAQIASLRETLEPGGARLIDLAKVRRAAAAGLSQQLNPDLTRDLQKLRFAPVLVNADARSASQPLTHIRQAERGIGDHALTIFDTHETYVFDQSHIFFDGILGAALAEIMTNEALSWAVYLDTLPVAEPADRTLFTRLDLPLTGTDADLILAAPRVMPEAVAESEGVSLRSVSTLRRLFRQRNDQIDLTVNDLLVMYRAIHAATYQPSADLSRELETLAVADPILRPLVQSIFDALAASRRVNPAMLIPIDASRRIPRDRLYPLSLEVPLAELDLLAQHARVLQSLGAYETASGDRSAIYADFDQRQRTYLASLAGLGTILARWKEIAVQGESASVGAIKLLANLPPAVQSLLDKMPARFELLNNMLKGREVFSNVGPVVPTSTLSRFVTAKDDNEQKQLVWAVLTDANGVMHISLRDFRPHVADLHAAGQARLADRITQDYLDAYVNGFNAFVRDLKRITVASRRTSLSLRKVP